MHKIYSRRKIRIPKVKFRGDPNDKRIMYTKKISKIAVVLLVAFSVVIITIRAVSPIFETLCEDKAKSIATIIANEQATVVMREHSYEDLFSVEKDQNGNVKMIQSNVFPINEIISDIGVKIQEKINEEGRDDIEIALGSFTGVKILAGRGPFMKIRVSSIGNVETDLRSEFVSQGINQTLHRVYLQVKCEVSILTPFNNITKNITNQVLLLENVIVGNIPSTYYNLEGLDNSKDALEIVE